MPQRRGLRVAFSAPSAGRSPTDAHRLDNLGMPSYHHAGVMRQGHADERHHEACEPWDLGPEEQGSGHEQQRAPAVNQAGADPPPSGLITMASGALRRVLPRVEAHVHHWRAQAQTIPSDELRKQALASIESKAFHCAGGGMYALLAGERHSEAVRFIVAFKTIIDYLDNLCDRSTSLDPDDSACSTPPCCRPSRRASPRARRPVRRRLTILFARRSSRRGYLAGLVRRARRCWRACRTTR